MVRAAVRCLRGAALALALGPALGPAQEPGAQPEAAQKAPAPKITFQVVLSALEPVSGGLERDAELYWASVTGEWKRGGFGARVELRGREGRFRSFYPGSVWLQEGYAFVESPIGELRVGKVVPRMGILDESFGGSLFSRNGVTRNPDWGLQLVGSRRFGWNSLEWQAAALGRNDRVSWEETGLGVESDPSASLREGFQARAQYLGYVWNGLGTVRPGLSLSTARLRREPGPADADPQGPPAARQELRRNEAALELTATVGPIAAMGQYLWRSVTGAPSGVPLAYVGSRGWLAGIRAEFPTVTYRYEVSGWSYGASGDVILHRPSVVWTPVRGLAATVEYSSERSRLGGAPRTLNSFRLGLALTY